MDAIIEINGQRYVKRQQTFTKVVSITSGLQVLTNQAMNLPGVADFILEARVRDVIASGASANNRFRYREGNTDNGQWYMAAGTGATNDRILDTLVFGTGQFPFPVVPSQFYSKNASIIYEVEDVSNSVPYDIHIAWIGAYLIPAIG